MFRKIYYRDDNGVQFACRQCKSSIRLTSSSPVLVSLPPKEYPYEGRAGKKPTKNLDKKTVEWFKQKNVYEEENDYYEDEDFDIIDDDDEPKEYSTLHYLRLIIMMMMIIMIIDLTK